MDGVQTRGRGRRGLRILAGVLGGGLALVVAAWLVVVAANWTDEAPDPELLRLSATVDGRLPDGPDAIYALAALSAPEGEDAQVRGRRWWERTLSDDARILAGGAPMAVADPAAPGAASPPLALCGPGADCLAQVAADPAAARAALEAGAGLLQRYDALTRLPYREPLRVLAPESAFAPAPPAHLLQLSSVRFAFAVQEGRHADALHHWLAERELLLKVAAGARQTFSLAWAIRRLQRQDLLLAAWISRHPEASRAHAARLLAASRPLSSAALPMKAALESEALDTQWLMRRAWVAYAGDLHETLARVLVRPLMLPQASANVLAGRIWAWRALDQLPGEAYRQAVMQARAQDDALVARSPLRLRNPLGTVLVQVALLPRHAFFASRDAVVAADAQRRIALGLLVAGPVDAAAVASALQGAGTAAEHRFTGQRLAWDPARRVLAWPGPADPRDALPEIRL